MRGDSRPQPAATPSRLRAACAEGLGTALLLATIVGSGIMGERLSGGNAAIALLANSLATGAALFALIVAIGPISGAHVNPVVTLAEAARGRFAWARAPWYVVAQLAGAIAGVIVAHAMFSEPLLMRGTHARTGAAQVFSEAVATFGLVTMIQAASQRSPSVVGAVVAAYIVAAYWFTASTSFANPAVTLARALTDTFSGIRPSDVPGFLFGQAAGGAAAVAVWRWLSPDEPTRAGATTARAADQAWTP